MYIFVDLCVELVVSGQSLLLLFLTKLGVFVDRMVACDSEIVSPLSMSLIPRHCIGQRSSAGYQGEGLMVLAVVVSSQEAC